MLLKLIIMNLLRRYISILFWFSGAFIADDRLRHPQVGSVINNELSLHKPYELAVQSVETSM